MIPDFLILPAVILAFITATSLLVSWNWRLSIFSLAIQYVCVVVLVSSSWPLETAAVKLVAGWMACAVMALALRNQPDDLIVGVERPISDSVFRLIAAVMAGLFAFTGGIRLVLWLPEISVEQAYGSMILIALGLLHLGLTNHPFRVVLGLLTLLSGFEILYAAVESSILIAGLLAIVTLGLAIICAYLLTAPTLEEAS
ncbi:MAG: hypothetical protein JSW42_12625 [Chloroflexota bacterium]|nr:MAG: hypothetical protein JSW42_12625 [Chloroflexota bacterium]